MCKYAPTGGEIGRPYFQGESCSQCRPRERCLFGLCIHPDDAAQLELMMMLDSNSNYSRDHSTAAKRPARTDLNAVAYVDGDENTVLDRKMIDEAQIEIEKSDKEFFDTYRFDDYETGDYEVLTIPDISAFTGLDYDDSVYANETEEYDYYEDYDSGELIPPTPLTVPEFLDAENDGNFRRLSFKRKIPSF